MLTQQKAVFVQQFFYQVMSSDYKALYTTFSNLPTDMVLRYILVRAALRHADRSEAFTYRRHQARCHHHEAKRVKKPVLKKQIIQKQKFRTGSC